MSIAPVIIFAQLLAIAFGQNDNLGGAIILIDNDSLLMATDITYNEFETPIPDTHSIQATTRIGRVFVPAIPYQVLLANHH